MNFAIYYNNKMIGVAGYHPLEKDNGLGKLGYWIDQNHQGKGIMTKVANWLVNYGFEELNLKRIEIRCGTKNLASQRVAQKLAMKEDGILKEAEWLYDRYVDHKVYYILREEKRG